MSVAEAAGATKVPHVHSIMVVYIAVSGTQARARIMPPCPSNIQSLLGHENSRELRYYNGAFRRGTPRPINPFSGDEWVTDGGVMEIDADQGNGGPKHSSSSPHVKHAVVSTIRRTAQGRNKGSLPEGTPSLSQIGSDDSQAIRLQPQSSVPIKKGFLGRFSLRNRSKKVTAGTSGNNIGHKSESIMSSETVKFKSVSVMLEDISVTNCIVYDGFGGVD
uniref:Microtubule-associated protein Jupiter n=1 Tax=Ascaris lumbricoides TaxID=6252 RepID=A0A0M3HR13_ASCLU